MSEILGSSSNPIVTEQTGKQWKCYKALGVVLVVSGVLTFRTVTGPAGQNFALWLLLTGVWAFYLGRFGAWWYHG